MFVSVLYYYVSILLILFLLLYCIYYYYIRYLYTCLVYIIIIIIKLLNIAKPNTKPNYPLNPNTNKAQTLPKQAKPLKP